MECKTNFQVNYDLYICLHMQCILGYEGYLGKKRYFLLLFVGRLLGKDIVKGGKVNADISRGK